MTINIVKITPVSPEAHTLVHHHGTVANVEPTNVPGAFVVTFPAQPGRTLGARDILLSPEDFTIADDFSDDM